MPRICLETQINAPIERVFDLCRSVEVHVRSTSHTDERAVGGVTSGLLGRGAFQSFTHNHYFRVEKQMTVVEDQFDYESPFGLIGMIVNQIVLTNYMSSFLRRRLDIVKAIAESDKWQNYLIV